LYVSLRRTKIKLLTYISVLKCRSSDLVFNAMSRDQRDLSTESMGKRSIEQEIYFKTCNVLVMF